MKKICPEKERILDMNNLKKARFKQTLFQYNQMYILVFPEEIPPPPQNIFDKIW